MSNVIEYVAEQIFDDLPLKKFSEAKSSELIKWRKTMFFYVGMEKFQFQESGSCNMYTFYFKEGKFNRLVCWDEPTERTEFDYSKEELKESYFEEAIYALIKSREAFEIKGGNEWISFKAFMKMIIEDNKFGPLAKKMILNEIERMSATINILATVANEVYNV